MKPDKINNFLPVNRKLFFNPLWEEKRTFSRFEAWIDLLQSARFEDSEASMLMGGKLIKWSRGEAPISLRFLADRWGWSKNKVDDFLVLLLNEQMIAKRTQEGTAQTIIKLCNYETYNGARLNEGQGKGQSRDSEGTARGQRGDNTNKDNKGNKENNVEEDTGEMVWLPKAIQAWQNCNCHFSAETKAEWVKLCASKLWKRKELSTLESSLSKIMKYEEDFAKTLIVKSEANGYQGIIFDNTDDKYQTWLKNKEGNATHKGTPKGIVIESGKRDFGKL